MTGQTSNQPTRPATPADAVAYVQVAVAAGDREALLRHRLRLTSADRDAILAVPGLVEAHNQLIADVRVDTNRGLDTARRGTEHAVITVLHAVDAPMATGWPGSGGPVPSPLELTRPGNPVHGLAAARVVADAAHTLVVGFALKARGAGATWVDVATALGISPLDGPDATADAAFLAIAGPPPDSTGGPAQAVQWACRTCDQLVTDYGPYGNLTSEGHENGHAVDCPRHNPDATEGMEVTS